MDWSNRNKNSAKSLKSGRKDDTLFETFLEILIIFLSSKIQILFEHFVAKSVKF